MPNTTPDQGLEIIENHILSGRNDLAEELLETWLKYLKSAQQEVKNSVMKNSSLWKQILAANFNIFISQHPKGTWATEKGLQGLIKYTYNLMEIMSFKPTGLISKPKNYLVRVSSPKEGLDIIEKLTKLDHYAAELWLTNWLKNATSEQYKVPEETMIDIWDRVLVANFNTYIKPKKDSNIWTIKKGQDGLCRYIANLTIIKSLRPKNKVLTPIQQAVMLLPQLCRKEQDDSVSVDIRDFKILLSDWLSRKNATIANIISTTSPHVPRTKRKASSTFEQPSPLKRRNAANTLVRMKHSIFSNDSDRKENEHSEFKP